MSGAITIRDKVAQIEKALEARQAVIAKSLPAHVLSPHRFQQVILTECAYNPALLDCKPASLFGAIIRGASLGLDPERALGQLYFVPFKGVVTLIVGYKGLINLAWQTGQMAAIGAASVRPGDRFYYQLGTDPWIKHRPDGDPDGKAFTHFYATAKTIGADAYNFKVMPLAEVKAVEARSPSARSSHGSPWKTDFEAMGLKSALRRLCKLLPATTERAQPLQRAIHIDELGEAGLKQRNAELLEEEESQEPDEQAIADGAREAEKS